MATVSVKAITRRAGRAGRRGDTPWRRGARVAKRWRESGDTLREKGPTAMDLAALRAMMMTVSIEVLRDTGELGGRGGREVSAGDGGGGGDEQGIAARALIAALVKPRPGASLGSTSL